MGWVAISIDMALLAELLAHHFIPLKSSRNLACFLKGDLIWPFRSPSGLFALIRA